MNFGTQLSKSYIFSLVLFSLLTTVISAQAAVEFRGRSAESLAFNIYQSQSPNGSLAEFAELEDIHWGQLITCQNSNEWICALPTVSENDIQPILQVPDEIGALPGVIQNQVLDNVRNHEFSMVGLSTSGWAQKLFFKDNHSMLKMTRAEDRYGNPIAFLNIHFVSCLIRPKYVGSIHFCWIKGVRKHDMTN